MLEYKRILKKVLETNNDQTPSGRKGMPNTISEFGLNAQYKISETDFNICTGKRVPFKLVYSELLWFMKGLTNVQWLNDRGNTIWNEDAYNYYKKLIKQLCTPIDRDLMLTFDEFEMVLKNGGEFPESLQETEQHFRKIQVWLNSCDLKYEIGDCGKQYGWLWRNNDHIDQLVQLIWDLKKNPFSRRHVLSAWNVRTLPEMALPACHSLSVFKVTTISGTKFLNCHLTQRSGDMFLGVPFNISSYTLMAIKIARLLGYNTGVFNHTIVDGHIYEDHIDACEDYLITSLNRQPILEYSPKFLDLEEDVRVALDGNSYSNYIYTINKYIDNLDHEDITLLGYLPAKTIKAKLHTGR